MRDYREVLPTVNVPTLICLGEDEKLLGTGGVEDAAAQMPEASLERFTNSGHCPFLEEPDRFNRVLSDFIDRLPD